MLIYNLGVTIETVGQGNRRQELHYHLYHCYNKGIDARTSQEPDPTKDTDATKRNPIMKLNQRPPQPSILDFSPLSP